jgi:hypothetical protein
MLLHLTVFFHSARPARALRATHLRPAIAVSAFYAPSAGVASFKENDDCALLLFPDRGDGSGLTVKDQ